MNRINSRHHYLPTVILYYYRYSITYSLFHSRLKTFLFCKSFPRSFSFSSSGLTTWIPPDCLRLLINIFRLVLFSVFTLFSCRFRAVD